MALTATASQGFELVRHTTEEEILYLPTDPGITVAKGDLLIKSVAGASATAGEQGTVVLGVGDDANHLGVAQESIVSPAATVPFPKPLLFDPVAKADTDKTLVPVKVAIASGVPIYKATFKNHLDDTVTAYSASTPSVTLGTGIGTNDYGNGALVYCYEGTGKGGYGIIVAYVQSTKVATLHRAFPVALDTTSKLIILEGAAAVDQGISLMGRIDAADEDELDCSDGADDGNWVVYMDWREMDKYLPNLTLPVIRTSALLG